MGGKSFKQNEQHFYCKRNQQERKKANTFDLITDVVVAHSASDDFKSQTSFISKNLIKVKMNGTKKMEVRKKMKIVVSEAMRKLYNLLS